jgi:hypothetical protein
MKLPRFVSIRQKFEGPVVKDIEAKVHSQLSEMELSSQLTPGMRIAITAGSRGIANMALITKAVVDWLKDRRADPFIVPAMGSHGGATAEGQIEVLESLGITEAYCGAPVLSSMEVVNMGSTDAGTKVYVDKNAWEADGIILLNRIKVHTDFKSPVGIESGLMKMAAIGMGKHKQALTLHTHGVHGIRDLMPEVARVVLAKAKILCGIGVYENAFEQTAKIEAIPTARIEERERALLLESAALMPKLPVDELDLLYVDKIGKNYSGTGMDTNIIGRMRILGVEEPEFPRIKYIIAGDLSEESHGNALGIGLADLTTKRLFNKIDYKIMNENVITSSFLNRAMIPIVMDNDREALQAALRSTWRVAPEKARIIRITNTLHLETMLVSETIYQVIKNSPGITVEGELRELEFDKDGNF